MGQATSQATPPRSYRHGRTEGTARAGHSRGSPHSQQYKRQDTGEEQEGVAGREWGGEEAFPGALRTLSRITHEEQPGSLDLDSAEGLQEVRACCWILLLRKCMLERV